MGLVILGDIDHIPGATVLSSTTEATGYDADNTLTRRRSQTWRSTSVAAAQTVTWDFGASKAVSGVGFLCNGVPGVTVEVDLDTDSAFAAPITYESGSINVPDSSTPAARGSVRRSIPHVLTFSEVTVRYGRIVMDYASHPDGYHELEVVMMGTPWTAPAPPAPFEYALEPAGPRYESRSFELVARWLSHQSKSELEDLLKAIGTDGRLLILPTSSRGFAIARETLYARVSGQVRFMGKLPGSSAATEKLWQVRIPLTEVLD